MLARTASLILLVAAASVAWATEVHAHTETDLIAVPTGEQVTVRLRPTHGCSGSPTVEVAIQAPVPGATAGTVPGWTSASTSEDPDRTVLRWTGGSLPADQEGEFPVTFTVVGSPGELLTFPAVQRCANGEELAWISGDPSAEYPAPRLLVLAAGSEPAASIDEVPADAPGRSLLTEIVDVDNGLVTTTTLPVPTTTPTTGPPTSTSEAASSDDDSSTGDGAPVAMILVIAAATVAAIAGANFWQRSSRD